MLRRVAPPRPRPDHHPCSLLEVLEHLVAFGPWPEVAKVYRTTQLSCARERAIRIMAQTDPGFATTAAVDCLWDCESETRRIACERVDLDAPGARERVEALAADPWESEQVRDAARARLT
ncbi:MAG: hypothetical protein IT303_08590 [Dehalococcoidia bacterium]|nr:hypothetical protein [Dehalococcoidia bacterium]